MRLAPWFRWVFVGISEVVAKLESLAALCADLSIQFSLLQLGFFDPLGLLKDADQAEFDRLREVEIKVGLRYHY